MSDKKSTGIKASSPPVTGHHPKHTGPRVPHIPPPGNRVLANISRPPLERASSVPERGGGSNTAPSSYSSSRTSIDRCIITAPNSEVGSKDALSNTRDKSSSRDTEKTNSSDKVAQEPKSRRLSMGSNERILIPVDENNIPQIDQAITPPASPKVKDPALTRVANTLQNSTFKGTKRFPSLKLRRTRVGSDKDSREDTPSKSEIHPTITITLDDDDEDSIISDYLSPDKNYKKDSKIQFIGDDVSLYGTPKEELSPLKEVDSKASSTSYLKDQIISFFQPSDNKLAMKLFGNKNALMKEKMRQKAAGNWVIHPCSNFRSVLFYYAIYSTTL